MSGLHPCVWHRGEMCLGVSVGAATSLTLGKPWGVPDKVPGAAEGAWGAAWRGKCPFHSGGVTRAAHREGPRA